MTEEPSATSFTAGEVTTSRPGPASSTAQPRRSPPTAVVVAVAVLAVAGFVTGGVLLLDRMADRRAAVAAATEDAREAIAIRAQALETAVATAGQTAAELHDTLQQHLTVSQRSDEQLSTDRENQEAALREGGEQLRALAASPSDPLPPRADRDALAGDLELLDAAQQRARDLGARLVELADASGSWAGALLALREQHSRYVSTVEQQPDTSQPDQLVTLWEQERTLLAEYRTAAEAARAVDGLAPVGDAYHTYVDHNAAFVEEAVRLLSTGDIDNYNRRLQEVFDVEDPFGFQASVVEASREALDAGVIAQLEEASQEAEELAGDLSALVERTAAEE